MPLLIKVLLFVSALLGAAGTLILFRGSFAYEGPPYLDYEDHTITKGMTARNKVRQSKQRLGLSLLMLSFVMQAIAIAIG